MREKTRKSPLDARKRLITSAEELGCALTESQIDDALAYVDLLERWNRRIRLVGPREVAELIDVHVADAIALAGRLRNGTGGDGQTLIDVGSGAGLPGLILSLMVPGIRVTLCETAEKRVTFLEEARRRLGMSYEVVHRDVRDLGRQRFDHAVARAVFAPEQWHQLAGSLIRENGCIWLMLTRKQLLDWKGGGEVFRYRVGGERERALVAVSTG